jgi:lipopolysaccharide/colanic/teichoic acid biosynthesis glycosyltransferase
MTRVKIHFNYLLPISFFITSIFIFAGTCYAQTNSHSPVQVPEPSTLLLLSTGIFGSIISFARRNFLIFKRFGDMLLAACGMVLVAPIITLTAILIKKVSPGPVFFTQQRVGLNGQIFTIYKMRTMKVNAEKETGAVWAQENDPRLIKYGKFIRKAHIDELPQLVNVLRGDMSIVGPRPERPEIVANLKNVICDYEKRLQTKPGITGLAQVWHKYDETLQDVKKKIKIDLLYIKRMCLWVDLRILARTVLVVFNGSGAR